MSTMQPFFRFTKLMVFSFQTQFLFITITKLYTSMNTEKTYLAIDLKSFYASVECVERNLNPLDTNLVVADSERTDHTICLAVSPSLKTYGIGGRPRLFEVKKRLDEVNLKRKAPNDAHTPKSYS